LDYLRPDNGDVLAVWKLDRLGRSVKDVLTIADDLHERGIGVRISSPPSALRSTSVSSSKADWFRVIA